MSRITDQRPAAAVFWLLGGMAAAGPFGGAILQINKVFANDRTQVANSPRCGHDLRARHQIGPARPLSQLIEEGSARTFVEHRIRHQCPTVCTRGRVERSAHNRRGWRRLPSTRALFVMNQGMFCNQPGHRTARWPMSDPPLSSIRAPDRIAQVTTANFYKTLDYLFLCPPLRLISPVIAHRHIIRLVIRSRGGKTVVYERDQATADDQPDRGQPATRQRRTPYHVCRPGTDASWSGGARGGPGAGKESHGSGHVARLQGGLDAFCPVVRCAWLCPRPGSTSHRWRLPRQPRR